MVHQLHVKAALIFLSNFLPPPLSCRTDQLKRQYTGVLCGLGHDPRTGESLYHEHDMELTFDTLFTNEDLLQV